MDLGPVISSGHVRYEYERVTKVIIALYRLRALPENCRSQTAEFLTAFKSFKMAVA